MPKEVAITQPNACARDKCATRASASVAYAHMFTSDPSVDQMETVIDHSVISSVDYVLKTAMILALAMMAFVSNVNQSIGAGNQPIIDATVVQVVLHVRLSIVPFVQVIK